MEEVRSSTETDLDRDRLAYLPMSAASMMRLPTHQHVHEPRSHPFDATGSNMICMYGERIAA